MNRIADSDFYEMVHQLLFGPVGPEESAGLERRGNNRHDFSRVQWIAPFVEGRLPGEKEFKQVACHDLSTSGFAFYASQRPNSMLLVVALGNRPYTYVLAEIVRVTPVHTEPGAKLVVGCQFVRRLEPREIR